MEVWVVNVRIMKINRFTVPIREPKVAYKQLLATLYYRNIIHKDFDTKISIKGGGGVLPFRQPIYMIYMIFCFLFVKVQTKITSLYVIVSTVHMNGS